MADQELFTSFCQNKVEEIYIRRNQYVWARETKTDFLVVHRNTFHKNVDTEIEEIVQLLDLIKPKYSNVYRVRVSTCDNFITCLGCKKKARTGFPCPHVLCIIGEVQPNMLHPRYLKVFNSWIYKKDGASSLDSSLTNLVNVHNTHIGCCPLGTPISLPEFVIGKVQFSPGVDEELHSKMVNLEKMHIHGVPLIRGDNPIVGIANDFEMNDDFDSEYGSEEEDRKNKKQTVKKKDSNYSGTIDHTTRFSSCESLLKDIWKQIEGNQEEENRLRLLLQQFHDDKVSENATELSSQLSQGSSLVSSQLENANYMNHNRTKRKHEHYRSK